MTTRPTVPRRSGGLGGRPGPMVLRMPGVPPDEARDIARHPLPDPA